MYNVALVAVIDCGQHLLDNVCGVALAEGMLLADALEEFPTVAKSTQ